MAPSRSRWSLLAETSLVALVAFVSSSAFAPPQCSGCEGQVTTSSGAGPGSSIDVCVGTPYYVRVDITAYDGTCIAEYPPQPSTPCLASGCTFDVLMSWKLPSSGAAHLCNTYLSVPHCVDLAANGEDQSLCYPLDSLCNGVTHNLSNSGPTPCGTIQAHVFATCTECE
jgi:hypothetical protein